MGRQLASKWLKTLALLQHPQIAGHIPHTERFTSETLHSMTELHGTVVLKPVRGGGGHGLIRVSKANGGYSLAHRTQRFHCPDFSHLLQRVNRIRKGRPYLIQKGIQLALVGGRPIDYRVKYVKNGAQWTFRSMVGRVARKGLFVTNLCQGGRMLSAANGLRQSLSSSHVAAKINEMRQLTKDCTAVLEQRFPGLSSLGYDYGIDQSGHIWILEVNTRPQ